MKEQTDRAGRRVALVAARMTVDGKAMPVTIANASSTGLMVRCDSPPDIGARVDVERGDARVSGKVVWRRGRRFGFHSTGPMDPAVLVGAQPRDALDLLLDKQDRVPSRIAWPPRRK
ncbi:PilZ domain-containing protein [Novosphingobium sp. ZN18A2]|uniref:PilZ domain-containing protein n=1 Tax=Novosphingobium sp. ZN18A2 TaxID=3079861 RepID=UPI0030D24D2F